MNKRQKLKNGIIFKKCDAKHCWIFRVVVKEKFSFSNSCYNCRHKSIMDNLIETRFKDIGNTEFCQMAKNLIKKKIIKRYPYMHEGKCLGLLNGKDEEWYKCKKCQWHYKEETEA